MNPPSNLADLVLDHPFAADDALLHDAGSGRSMTAGEVRAAVRARAAELGDVRGRAVAVQRPDSIDTVVTMAAIWHAGAVFVPVNARASDAEVARIVAATGPVCIIRDDRVEAVGGEPRVYDDGIAFVLWTSGTTGAPKPILHTHDDYLELLDRVLAPLRATPTPRWPESAGANRYIAAIADRKPTPNLIPVGLAQNAGIYNVLFGLRAGAAIVVLGRFETTSFAQAVRTHEIRSTVLPPTAIAMLADDESIADLAPLRYVRSITAPLSPRITRRFRDRFGVFVLNSYGQAEMGEVIGWTAADAKAHPDKLGAAGRPLPNVAIRVADPDGDGVGRLLVRPPRMAHGTADGTDDLARRTDADGFVDTGDLARVDADGFVWIEGRASDLINRGGNKVVPDEVEDVLRAVDGVRDAAVVAQPDERLGEVPVAVVVADDVSDDALEAACRAALVPYKVPVRFVRVETLPRNEAGKLQRAAIRESLR